MITKPLRLKIIGFLFIITHVSGWSQAVPSVRADELSKQDTTEHTSVHSLFAGTGLGSNLIYLGSTISEDKPFYYGTITYGLFDKLYLSASAYHLSGFQPFLASYSLSATFSHTFSSWFDISVSALGYDVQKELSDTLFSDFIYSDITLGFDWKILYTKVTAGAMFSGGSSGYLQVKNSRYFETPAFIDGKATFSFDPYVNLLMGKMVTVESSDGDTSTKPGGPPWKRPPKNNTTIISERFGIMEIDFGLPIDFNYDFFTIEFEPGYILTTYEDPDYQGIQGFLFMISVYFSIL